MYRKNQFVSILAVIMVLCSLFSFSAALADGETATLTNGVYTGSVNTIGISKTVLVTNTDSTVQTVYGPNITYTYSVTPAEANKTITDSAENSIQVKPGIEAATTSPVTVAFTSSAVTLSDGRGSVTGSALITFTPSAFGAPGVYRYEVRDTTTAQSMWAAGLVRASDYKASHYLDVYVAYREGAGKTAENLIIQGYVFLDTDSDVGGAASTSKLAGFTDETTTNTAAEGTIISTGSDLYPTFNVCVSQTVEGNMSDATHEFPIAITVSNPSSGSQVTTKMGKGATAASAATDSGSLETPPTLKHGDQFWIVGLNVRSTVVTAETNDTADTYQVQIKNSSDVLTASAAVAHNETATHDAVSLSDYPTTESNSVISTVIPNTTNTKIQYTNSLSSVSPTGVARKVAPFASMMVFAFFFALLIKKRRDEEDEVAAN